MQCVDDTTYQTKEAQLMPTNPHDATWWHICA